MCALKGQPKLPSKIDPDLGRGWTTPPKAGLELSPKEQYFTLVPVCPKSFSLNLCVILSYVLIGVGGW